MFDEGIATEENIPVLEEIGKLALHCINLKFSKRPTMKEVAERLKKIRRWCNGHEGYRICPLESISSQPFP
uniref:Serine-threonine/tyrosine-protein kinase catalytic domain-containing protein n=1 Tax=Oryza barthii TaxID=65489 RepID=A0A0D3HN09_9ORYZ